jgi:hypothetical protein
MSLEDWKEWGNKLKWNLISFKFLSFYTVIGILLASWYALERIYKETISTAKELHSEGLIDQQGVFELIKHIQTVLFDSAVGHIAVAASVVLSAIIAAKMVSYYSDSRQASEVVKKLENGQLSGNLDRFLPKRKKHD